MDVFVQIGQWQLPWNTLQWEVFRMCCNRTHCHPMLAFPCFLTLQKPWLTFILKTSFIVTSSLAMCLCVPLTLRFIPWQSLFPFLSFFNKTDCEKRNGMHHNTQHNTQDIRLWRSTNSGVDGGKHDHDKWCWHTVFHGTRNGHWHQTLHWCCGCLQLCHHGCSGHGWEACL